MPPFTVYHITGCVLEPERGHIRTEISTKMPAHVEGAFGGGTCGHYPAVLVLWGEDWAGERVGSHSQRP